MSDSERTAVRGGRFRRDPHPALGPFIVEYWGIARDLAAMGGFTITPDCFGELICCVDEMVVVEEGEKVKLPTCFLVGLLDRPLLIEAPGVVRCMAARLRPWTVGRFLANAPDLPPRGWTNAEALFGPLLSMVAEMLGRCDWQPLSALFDQLLMQELGACQPGHTGIEIVEPFLDQIRRSTAIVAGERDTSIRQVERRVRALTGTSPKRLASLSRFQTARDAIWANPSIGLAQLAIDAGYSDQPHMTREFKRYCGQSPARFARGLAAKKKWLAAQDVAFVQEHPAPDE